MQLDRMLKRVPEQLTAHDVQQLLEAPPAARQEIALAADELARSRHGDVVTYVVNRNLNFTNVCSVRCHFCAFYRNENHPEAFRLDVESAIARLAETPDVTEVCVQGGIDHTLPISYYVNLVKAIKQWQPTIHLHAFSPQEIHSLAEREGQPVSKILIKLLDAGLDSMPGTAAEILDFDVRKKIAPRRLSIDAWENIVTIAHGLGIPSSATMMFGHVENNAHRAEHMLRIRRLQEKTLGFTEFVPMPFVAGQTALQRAGMVNDTQPGAKDNAHIIAVSRLLFNDILPNIQVSWVKNGFKEAGQALRSGANDLGGTLFEENITRLAGGKYGSYATPLQFRQIARTVGLRAKERTTLYDRLTREAKR